MTTKIEKAKHEKRVVVGIDGSPASIEALRWALKYAALTDSATDVIVAWEWPANPGWALYPSDFDPGVSAEQMLDSLTEQLRCEFPDQPIEGKVIQGHAAPLLVEASASADLLVVANRGHGEFVGMLLGSVSEHCVAHAHCPVVVFRGGVDQPCSSTPQ